MLDESDGQQGKDQVACNTQEHGDVRRYRRHFLAVAGARDGRVLGISPPVKRHRLALEHCHKDVEDVEESNEN